MEPGRGRWSVPGGAVELGEIVKDAIVREAFKESNLEVRPIEFVGYYDYIAKDSGSDVRFLIIYWLCESVGGHARASSDATDAKWVDFADLEEYDITGGTLNMLQKVERRAGDGT